MNPTDKSKLYAGIIWILSGLALLIYGVLLYFNTSLPGMAELVHFLNTVDKKYIYLGAFASIFIEGLYFIGSFFPGASLVVVLAIVSQVGGFTVFATTILLIFVGWSLAGVLNIYLAKVYRKKILKLTHNEDYHINDRVWTTWFPAFRASYEVAQVAEGGKPLKVFMSSLRVRFWASVFVGCLAFILPLFFDISKTTDREGYLSIAVVIIISVLVGVKKIRGYYSLMHPNTRKAELKDANAIAKIHIETWQSHYCGQLPDEYLNTLSVEKRAKTWTENLSDVNSKIVTFVCEENNTILGFCTVGPCRDVGASDDTGELYAIYIEASQQGRGIGSSLMTEGLNYLRSQGYKKVTLWVLKTNTNTIHFYEKKVWKADGREMRDEKNGVVFEEVGYEIEL